MIKRHSFNERLAAIARALLHEPDVQATLKRVRQRLAGAPAPAVEAPVYSDDRALWTDQLQYELGSGPCLDAVWRQDMFHRCRGKPGATAMLDHCVIRSTTVVCPGRRARR